MQTLYLSERTGRDGILNIRIPLGVPEQDFEVVLVVRPREAASAPPPGAPGWPPGYFEETFGSITDETFDRPPQGELPLPLDLE